MWLKTGELLCDNEPCNAKFSLEQVVPQVLVIAAARIHGWHCYTGPSITNKDLDIHVCPDCMGRLRPPGGTSKAKPLKEDVPLFDGIP